MATRQDYLRRWEALKTERAGMMGEWADLSRVLQPRLGRFFVEDKNRNNMRRNTIRDSTATRAHRICAAGLMSGNTSPARPWFRTGVGDSEMSSKSNAVRVWLSDVDELMRRVFTKSNTYRALHTMYEELGAFGTGASLVVDDFDTVIHHHPMTVGEYAVAVNSRGVVDTIYRHFQMTARTMVQEFGKAALSTRLQQRLEDGKGLDDWVTVVHAIEPRADRDPSSKLAKDKKFASVYFEHAGEGGKFLRESGFDAFPALAPRWAVLGGDAYGTSPGMEAYGDIMQLQHEQLRKGQAIDYQTQPPLQVPMALRGSADLLPGGVNYVDMAGGANAIRSAFEVQLYLRNLLEDITDVRQRINSSFYADVFAMMLQDDRSGTTAREIAERHEEKLLMLGPVLERLDNELLAPLIDITFSRIVRAGMLPPPPPEMHGQDLKIEFVSVLAQAQRAVGVASVDRLLDTVGSIAAFKPDVIDKLDTDSIVDLYGDMLGVDPSLIVADERVAIIRQDRAKQQQQAQAAENAQKMAGAAKDASGIDPSNMQALSDNIRGLTGYGGASV